VLTDLGDPVLPWPVALANGAIPVSIPPLPALQWLPDPAEPGLSRAGNARTQSPLSMSGSTAAVCRSLYPGTHPHMREGAVVLLAPVAAWAFDLQASTLMARARARAVGGYHPRLARTVTDTFVR
jgi:hypothetical protein